MRFYAKKRRQPPAIIIVALIDILIVLLIFLMVTSTFKQQPALRLSLPESSHAQKAGASENAAMVLTVDTNGNMRLGPEGKPVTAETLTADLKEEVAKKPELRLAISADKRAPFGQVIKAMDAAKEAKVQKIEANIKQAAP